MTGPYFKDKDTVIDRDGTILSSRLPLNEVMIKTYVKHYDGHLEVIRKPYEPLSFRTEGAVLIETAPCPSCRV